jgi:hypothetical protein
MTRRLPAISTGTHPRHRPSHGESVSIERSHRIDSEEFYRLLEGVVIDADVFNNKLREWEDY